MSRAVASEAKAETSRVQIGPDAEDASLGQEQIATVCNLGFLGQGLRKGQLTKRRCFSAAEVSVASLISERPY